MSSGNYATFVTVQQNDATASSAYVSNSSVPETGDVTINNSNCVTGALQDPIFWNIMCLGDQ